MAKILSDDEVFGAGPGGKVLTDEEVFGPKAAGPKAAEPVRSEVDQQLDQPHFPRSGTRAGVQSGRARPVDPTANATSVMADLPPGATPEGVTQSLAPVKPEIRSALESAYDAGSPTARAKLAGQPGYVGQITRERAQGYANVDAAGAPTTNKLDRRAEKRAELINSTSDMDPAAARVLGKTDAALGRAPGAELPGTVSPTDIDFGAAKDWQTTNSVARGVAKGGLGVAQGYIGLGDMMADVAFGDAGQSSAAHWAQRKDAEMGDRSGFLTSNFEGAVSSIAQQLPMMALGVATGSEALALAGMGLQSVGQEYLNGKQAGLPLAERTTRAAIFGAFEILGEKLGLGTVLDQLGKAARGVATDRLIPTLAKNLATKEVPGELFTSTGEFLTDKDKTIGLNQQATMEDYLKTVADTIAQTVMQGGIQAGGGHAVNKIAQRFAPPPEPQPQSLFSPEATAADLRKPTSPQVFQSPEADAAGLPPIVVPPRSPEAIAKQAGEVKNAAGIGAALDAATAAVASQTEPGSIAATPEVSAVQPTIAEPPAQPPVAESHALAPEASEAGVATSLAAAQTATLPTGQVSTVDTPAAAVAADNGGIWRQMPPNSTAETSAAAPDVVAPASRAEPAPPTPLAVPESFPSKTHANLFVKQNQLTDVRVTGDNRNGWRIEPAAGLTPKGDLDVRVADLNAALERDARSRNETPDVLVPVRDDTSADARITRILGRTFGVNIDRVSGLRDNGLYHKGSIYLSDKLQGSAAVIWTALHEAVHHFGQVAAEQTQPFFDAVRANVRPGVLEARQARESRSLGGKPFPLLAERGADFAKRNSAEEETAADVFGFIGLDHQTWNLAAQREPALARKIVYRFLENLTKAINALSRHGVKVHDLVDNYEAIRAAAVDMLAGIPAAKTAPEATDDTRHSRAQEDIRKSKAEWTERKGKPNKSDAHPGLNIEVAPNPDDTKRARRWASIPGAHRERISKVVGDKYVRQALDRMGVKYTIEHTQGGFLGETNPSIIIRFTDKNLPFDEINAIGQDLGKLLDQQAVITYDENLTKGENLTTFVKLVPDRRLTQAEVAGVFSKVFESFPDAAGFTFRDGGMVFGNFSEKSAEEFHAGIDAAVADHPIHFESFRRVFRSDYLETANRDRNAQGTETGRDDVWRGERGLGAIQAALRRDLNTEVKRAREPSSRSSVGLREGTETLDRFGFPGGGKPTVRRLAEALDKRASSLGKISEYDTSDRARDEIADAFADEVEHQLVVSHNEETGSGEGWYSVNWPAALRKLGAAFPELATSKEARALFTMILAVTSNGERVKINFSNAVRVYDAYVHGDTDLTQTGLKTKQQAALDGNLRAIKDLVEKMGVDAATDFLLEELPISEMNKGLPAKDRITSYPADAQLPRAAMVFGPKLGAFFANLMGSHGYLTMDLWWTRSFNRVRGNLIGTVTDSALDDFKALMGDPEMSDDEAVLMAMPYEEEYAANKYKIPKDYKGDPAIVKKANTIVKAALLEINQAPIRAEERAFMIRTAKRTQEILAERGHHLTIADVQAALWYYEKRLYRDLGTKERNDIGYEEAVDLFLRDADRPQRSAAGADRFAAVGSEAGTGARGEPGPDIRRSTAALSDDELRARGARVSQYVADVQSKRPHRSRLHVGVIDEIAARRISEAIGESTTGSMEIVLPNRLAHVGKNHPGLTLEDWSRLPEVTDRFDEVAPGREDPNPALTRVVIRKVLAGANYGAVYAFAKGPTRGGRRLSLVTFFTGNDNQAAEWWEKNKGLNPDGVPNLTEPANSAPVGTAKPSDESVSPATPDVDTRRTSAWTEKRIDRLIRYYGNSRTNAYAAWIGPDKFLAATTTKASRPLLERQRRPLDAAQLAAEDQEIYLDVKPTGDDGTYRIVSHEGRHRMMALRDAGVRSVPVVVALRDGQMTDADLDEAYLDRQHFGPDSKAEGGIDVSGMVPIDAVHRDALLADFGGDADIRFSRAQESTPEFQDWSQGHAITNPSTGRLVWYHGTAQDITQFRAKQAGAIFVTQEPAFAEMFSSSGKNWMAKHAAEILTPEQLEAARKATVAALKQRIVDGEPRAAINKMLIDFKTTDEYAQALHDQMPSSENLMPVYVRAADPFDYENRLQVDDLVDRLFRAGPVKPRGGHYTDSKMPSVQIDGHTRRTRIELIDSLGSGDWSFIESPTIQAAIRALGHDGFYVQEGGFKNLAVYSPNQIKSATGNDGSFSREDDDIRRSAVAPLSDEVLRGLADLGTSMRHIRGSEQYKLARPQITRAPMTNLQTGVIASVSGEALGKMASKSNIQMSVSPQAHYQALGNIDRLFPLAMLREERPGKKEGDAQSINRILHFETPMPFDGDVLRVKMLVKEFARKEQGTRVYLVEAVEIEAPLSFRGEPVPEGARSPHPPSGAESRFSQMVAAVKGEPTNDRRYSRAQEDTPQFKAWFGDSKVVDADGTPLVVYHGTRRDFDAFDAQHTGSGMGNTGFLGTGFYFTRSPFTASGYAGNRDNSIEGRKILPVYLSLQRPLNITGQTKNGPLPTEVVDAINAALPASAALYPFEHGDGSYKFLTEFSTAVERSPETAREFSENLRRAGYDGIIYRDGEEIVVFDPEQIKSAIGNDGSFDRSNPDIRRSVADLNPFERDALGRFRFAWGNRVLGAIVKVVGPAIDLAQMRLANPELRKAMRAMKVAVAKAQETAVGMAKEMKDLDPGQAEMISDIVEKELVAGVTPPAELVTIAGKISALMTAQTNELLRLGMISPEAAARWSDRYLPRFYSSKLLKHGDPWMQAVRNATRQAKALLGIKGNSLRARGLPLETIPVADLPARQATGWEIRDKNYDPATSTEVTVWRDFTRAERDAMGELRDARFRVVMGYIAGQKDVALGRLFERIANTQASAGAQPGWVKVPDTEVADTGVKRYGKLAGMWVPKDVFAHLSQYNDTSQYNELMNMYRKAMGAWKESKTVLNPTAHANNIMGNLTMAHFAGVSYWDWHKYAGAINDLARNAPMVQEAKDAGLFLSTLTHDEIVQALPEPLRVLAAQQKNSLQKGASLVWNAMSFFLRKPMGKAYSGEDLLFRYVIFRDARKRGLSAEDATNYAADFIFEYDDLPKGARVARDTALPFFSWTYKAIPALATTALNYPHRYLAPATVLYMANLMGYLAAFGGDDDEWWKRLQKYASDADYHKQIDAAEEAERKNLPPWLKGSGLAMWTKKAIRLGTDKVTSLPVFLDASRIVPAGDLMDAENNAGGIPWLQSFRPNSPVITTIEALFGNRDAWTGKDVVDKNDTSAEAAAKRAEWAWKQFTPAIAVGNYQFDRAANAVANAAGIEIPGPFTDYTGIGRDGLPVQPKYAAMQTFGIKARPLDLDASEQIEAGKTKALIQDLSREINRTVRLMNAGAMSESQGGKLIDRNREKQDRLRQGLTIEGDEKQ